MPRNHAVKTPFNNQEDINNSRDSNIEFLRIVCMIMILLLHVFVGPDKIEHLDAKILFDYFRNSFCIPAVNMFVIVSGYFSINWRWKSLRSLIIQVYYFVIIGFVLAYILNLQMHEMSWSKALWISVNSMVDGYWFITSYMILYIIAPILNYYCKCCDKRALGIIILVITGCMTYYSLNSVKANIGYNTVFLFILLYLIGRYIRKYTEIQMYKKSRLFVIYLLLTLGVMMLALGSKYFFNNNSGVYFIKGGEYSNILVIGQAIVGFIFFRALKLKSKFTNYIGASALSIYLFHMSPGIKNTYYALASDISKEPFFQQQLCIMALVSGALIIAVVLDKIRTKIFYKYSK